MFVEAEFIIRHTLFNNILISLVIKSALNHYKYENLEWENQITEFSEMYIMFIFNYKPFAFADA